MPKIFHVERTSATRYCQIFCVMAGRGELSYRGKVYPLSPGDLGILRSGEPHAYSSDPDAPMGQVWMEFYGANSTALVEHILSQCGPILHGAVVGRVETLLGTMINRLTVTGDRSPSLEVYEILLELLRSADAAPLQTLSPDVKSNFALVEGYINAHLGENIPNQTLANLCGVSLSYFVKGFKKVYRTTPQQYVANRRVAKAKYMLTETTASLESICEALGFCNTSHFVRCFRACEGITPAQYRRQHSLMQVPAM